jgi:Domain of unknown function (DUF4249)
MFNKKIHILLIILLISGFISCEDSPIFFEINTPKENKIVLNALLVARQSPRVYVGRNWGPTIGTPQPSFYNNADVELFEEGKSVGKLLLKDTMYVNPNYVIKPNLSYTIKANVQNVGTVESEPVLIPPNIIITKVIYDKKTTVVVPDASTLEYPCLITTTFQKVENVAGYGIDILAYNEEGRIGCDFNYLDIKLNSFIKSPCYFDLNLPEIDLSGNVRNSISSNRGAYTNKCIDTPEKEFRVVANLKGGSLRLEGNNIFTPKNRLINQYQICITTLSNEALEFSKSIKIFEDFYGALSEPNLTYSNVKGGLGVVAGYNVSYKVINVIR